MLGKPQLTGLFDHLGTPSKGQALVREARIKAPVREVKSQGSNVVTIFVSRKMAREIRTESRHIEFPAALNHEFDPAVLEFYPQPCKLHMELIDDATGEIHPIHHTPDFLVLRADGVTLEEWKSDDKLAGLAKRYPYRYQRDSDGNWCAPKIQEHLAEMGTLRRIGEDDFDTKLFTGSLHLREVATLMPGDAPDTIDNTHRANPTSTPHYAHHHLTMLGPAFSTTELHCIAAVRHALKSD